MWRITQPRSEDSNPGLPFPSPSFSSPATLRESLVLLLGVGGDGGESVGEGGDPEWGEKGPTSADYSPYTPQYTLRL